MAKRFGFLGEDSLLLTTPLEKTPAEYTGATFDMLQDVWANMFQGILRESLKGKDLTKPDDFRAFSQRFSISNDSLLEFIFYKSVLAGILDAQAETTDLRDIEELTGAPYSFSSSKELIAFAKEDDEKRKPKRIDLTGKKESSGKPRVKASDAAQYRAGEKKRKEEEEKRSRKAYVENQLDLVDERVKDAMRNEQNYQNQLDSLDPTSSEYHFVVGELISSKQEIASLNDQRSVLQKEYDKIRKPPRKTSSSRKKAPTAKEQKEIQAKETERIKRAVGVENPYDPDKRKRDYTKEEWQVLKKEQIDIINAREGEIAAQDKEAAQRRRDEIQIRRRRDKAQAMRPTLKANAEKYADAKNKANNPYDRAFNRVMEYDAALEYKMFSDYYSVLDRKNHFAQVYLRQRRTNQNALISTKVQQDLQENIKDYLQTQDPKIFTNKLGGQLTRANKWSPEKDKAFKRALRERMQTSLTAEDYRGAPKKAFMGTEQRKRLLSGTNKQAKKELYATFSDYLPKGEKISQADKQSIDAIIKSYSSKSSLEGVYQNAIAAYQSGRSNESDLFNSMLNKNKIRYSVDDIPALERELAILGSRQGSASLADLAQREQQNILSKYNVPSLRDLENLEERISERKQQLATQNSYGTFEDLQSRLNSRKSNFDLAVNAINNFRETARNDLDSLNEIKRVAQNTLGYDLTELNPGAQTVDDLYEQYTQDLARFNESRVPTFSSVGYRLTEALKEIEKKERNISGVRTLKLTEKEKRARIAEIQADVDAIYATLPPSIREAENRKVSLANAERAQNTNKDVQKYRLLKSQEQTVKSLILSPNDYDLSRAESLLRNRLGYGKEENTEENVQAFLNNVEAKIAEDSVDIETLSERVDSLDQEGSILSFDIEKYLDQEDVIRGNADASSGISEYHRLINENNTFLQKNKQYKQESTRLKTEAAKFPKGSPEREALMQDAAFYDKEIKRNNRYLKTELEPKIRQQANYRAGLRRAKASLEERAPLVENLEDEISSLETRIENETSDVRKLRLQKELQTKKKELISLRRPVVITPLDNEVIDIDNLSIEEKRLLLQKQENLPDTKKLSETQINKALNKYKGKLTYRDLRQFKEESQFFTDSLQSMNYAATLVSTELSAAYNLGRLQVYISRGVKYVQWVSVLDKGTSMFCRSLNGKIFKTSDYAILGTNLGLQPFPNTRAPEYAPENRGLVGKNTDGVGIWVPPAHLSCRSYLQPIYAKKEHEAEEKIYRTELENRLRRQHQADPKKMSKERMKEILDKYVSPRKSEDMAERQLEKETEHRKYLAQLSDSLVEAETNNINKAWKRLAKDLPEYWHQDASSIPDISKAKSLKDLIDFPDLDILDPQEKAAYEEIRNLRNTSRTSIISKLIDEETRFRKSSVMRTIKNLGTLTQVVTGSVEFFSQYLDYKNKKEKEKIELSFTAKQQAVETLLLGGAGVLGLGTMYYFLHKSNLMEEINNYVQHVMGDVITITSTGVDLSRTEVQKALSTLQELLPKGADKFLEETVFNSKEDLINHFMRNKSTLESLTGRQKSLLDLMLSGGDINDLETLAQFMEKEGYGLFPNKDNLDIPQELGNRVRLSLNKEIGNRIDDLKRQLDDVYGSVFTYGKGSQIDLNNIASIEEWENVFYVRTRSAKGRNHIISKKPLRKNIKNLQNVEDQTREYLKALDEIIDASPVDQRQDFIAQRNVLSQMLQQAQLHKKIKGKTQVGLKEATEAFDDLTRQQASVGEVLNDFGRELEFVRGKSKGILDQVNDLQNSLSRASINDAVTMEEFVNDLFKKLDSLDQVCKKELGVSLNDLSDSDLEDLFPKQTLSKLELYGDRLQELGYRDFDFEQSVIDVKENLKTSILQTQRSLQNEIEFLEI